MKQTTKYNYEKRIKELQEELRKANDDLYEYKQLALSIHADLTQMVRESKQISQGYILSLYKRVFR